MVCTGECADQYPMNHRNKRVQGHHMLVLGLVAEEILRHLQAPTSNRLSVIHNSGLWDDVTNIELTSKPTQRCPITNTGPRGSCPLRTSGQEGHTGTEPSGNILTRSGRVGSSRHQYLPVGGESSQNGWFLRQGCGPRGLGGRSRRLMQL